MLPNVDIQALNPLLADDAVRQERWAFLTEGLEEDVKGYGRTDPDSIASRKRVMEAMLDNQLRTIDAGTGEPMIMPLEFVPHFSQQLKENRLYEADVAMSSIGWLAPASNPPTNSKIFTTQSLGMVRRVFPRLLAMDLVSVQPMSQPTGKVFYLDFEFSHDATEGSITGGQAHHDRDIWVDGSGEVYADFDVDDASATIEGNTAREMNLDMSEVTVTARAKKLAADWSVEIQQDLRAYHGLSADSEMMQALSKQITYEIDRTVLTELQNVAFNEAQGAGIVTWNKDGYDGTDPVQQRAWDETLYDAIEDTAAEIEEIKYVKPQWLVMGVRTAARFRKLNGFRAATSDDFTMSLGTGARTIFGTVSNRWFVYVDPWMVEDRIIMGYKGTSFGEAGHVYAPYIPMYRTPQFTDPKTFVHSRGIMSRFGSVTVNGEYYAGLQLTSS